MGLKLLIFASLITHCRLHVTHSKMCLILMNTDTHIESFLCILFLFINPALYTVYGTPDFSTN